MAWDAAQYLQFAAPRQRPAVELIAHIPLATPAAIVDLGCGPGTVTHLLRQRWPHAGVTGVDGAAEMLSRARHEFPGIRWVQGDIGDASLEFPCDLLFSNAALHWVPDHPGLFARLRRWIRPGGVLAVQMPDNFAAASHRLVRELAASARFRERVGAVRMGAVLAASDYHALLSGIGGQVNVWSTEYLQMLDGATPVLDWLRGTTLVPYLERLGDDAEPFIAELAPALADAYPPAASGRTPYPFRRLFIVARF